jgi:hypothetical protein
VRPAYDHRNLQSLFGYGVAAHVRSGGICQLCGCGAGEEVDFDLWRQMTIEHLIGESQGGYPKRIKVAVEANFSHLPAAGRAALADRIHEANVVTACQFCNSTTSRDVASVTMEEVVAGLPGDPDEAIVVLADRLQPVLDAKRRTVQWKLEAVYTAFCRDIRPSLVERRREEPAFRQKRNLSAFDVSARSPASPA